MEPVDRARQSSECVTGEIVTANVRHLVQQHGQAPVRRPLIGLSGKHDRRTENTAGERHLRIFAAQQSWRLVERQAVGHFI